jgi:hypothetical protein
MTDDQNMAVVGHASVDSYFREVLIEALGRAKVEATPGTEFYLVGLLGEFTKARISDEPIALKLAKTERAEDRVAALKEIGDTTLYVSGFFAESFSRQLIDVDYYIGMGGAAYSELASRLKSSSVAEVYAELSANFPRFVDVLHCVRSQIHLASDDVVGLYQEWLKTRSEWVEDRLCQLGVVVKPPGEPEGGGYMQ